MNFKYTKKLTFMQKKRFQHVAYFQIIYAASILLFWIYFFLFENSLSRNNEIYLAYERSFPFAGLCFLIPCLILGAYALLKNKVSGLYYSLIAGSIMLFLALLDISFSVQQNLYFSRLSNGILYGCIHATLLIFGIILLKTVWDSKIFVKKEEGIFHEIEKTVTKENILKTTCKNRTLRICNGKNFNYRSNWLYR